MSSPFGLGCPKSEVGRIEAGEREPSVAVLERLLAACGLALEVRVVLASSVTTSVPGLRSHLARPLGDRIRDGLDRAAAAGRPVGGVEPAAVGRLLRELGGLPGPRVVVMGAVAEAAWRPVPAGAGPVALCPAIGSPADEHLRRSVGLNLVVDPTGHQDLAPGAVRLPTGRPRFVPSSEHVLVATPPQLVRLGAPPGRFAGVGELLAELADRDRGGRQRAPHHDEDVVRRFWDSFWPYAIAQGQRAPEPAWPAWPAGD